MHNFAFNLEKLTPEIWYTDTVCGICNKYQVRQWQDPIKWLSEFDCCQSKANSWKKFTSFFSNNFKLLFEFVVIDLKTRIDNFHFDATESILGFWGKGNILQKSTKWIFERSQEMTFDIVFLELNARLQD